jgi:hypothetical protein
MLAMTSIYRLYWKTLNSAPLQHSHAFPIVCATSATSESVNETAMVITIVTKVRASDIVTIQRKLLKEYNHMDDGRIPLFEL